MLLHNYILKDRDKNAPVIFTEIDLDSTQNALTTATGKIPIPLVTDNNETRNPGRRSQLEENSHRKGDEKRHDLTVKLAIHNLRRPMQNGMRYNNYGHVYFEG